MTNQINISFTNENKLKIILDDKLVDPLRKGPCLIEPCLIDTV